MDTLAALPSIAADTHYKYKWTYVFPRDPNGNPIPIYTGRFDVVWIDETGERMPEVTERAAIDAVK